MGKFTESSQPEKILIVDDMLIHLETAKLYLEKAGFTVSCALDAERAWQLVCCEQPDLVLLDVMLPGENGLKILEKIKSSYPSTWVVIMTAFGSEEIAARALHLGAVDYIRKPLKYSELVDVVKKVIAQQREERNKELEMQSLKNAYEELQVSADSILRCLSSAVIAVDVNLKISMINQKARELFNLQGDPIGEYYYDVFPRYKNNSLLKKTLENEKPQQIYGIKYNGLNKIFDVRTDVIRDRDGNKVGAVIVYDDITVFWQMEKTLRANEHQAVIGQMAAGVAHELKNPLTVIKGFAQLITARCDEEIKSYMQAMNTEIERMQEVIQNFLQLARPKPPNFAPCNINKIIMEMLPLINSQTYARGIKVYVKTDSNIPESLMDAAQIKQLLLNLVQNAVEAISDEGEIWLETKYLINRQICLQVVDSGCGIEPDKLDKLCQPFFTTKDTGTGLGLSICQSIVQQHGGKIKVDSKAGVGTVFSVYLPVDSGKNLEKKVV